MAEATRRIGSGLGADAARRLLSRPIHHQTARPVRPALPQPLPQDAAAADDTDLTRKLESQIFVMKAVLAAERRENASLRACIGMDDETLGEEARAVRDRWADLVDKLLNTAV